MKDCDKNKVKHHVGDTGGNCDSKTKLWAFRCDQKALKYILQHKCGQGAQDYAPVHDAVVKHLACGAKGSRDRVQKEESCQREHDAASDNNIDHHRKILVCPVRLSLSKCL